MSIDVVLGIDIGGTFSKFGIVEESGNVLFEEFIETEEFRCPEEFTNTIYEITSRKINDHNDKLNIIGVGIGAPNANFYTGNIEFAPNLPWKGVVKLSEIVQKCFQLPVVVTNDANAAAIGEMIFGDAKGLDNFLMITLGTGLGSGLIVNGDVVYGHDGFAGELGHVCVEENGRMCGCGKRGCLETYVSASGIKRTVFELLATEIEDSPLRAMSFNEMDSLHVTKEAEKNDPIAIKSFKKTGTILGKALATTVAHISPEQIFLFGGLARAGKWIFEPTKKSMEHNLLTVFKDKISIKPSALLDKNIAVLGAAALIWKKLKSS